MGNTASSTPASGEASVDSSGVTLSPRLQAKIVQDFQTRVQAEWLQRSDNIKQQEQANSELSKEHKTFLDQSNKAQATLDQRYEKLDAVFHDQVVAADYDASALQQKYQVKEILGQESPCADVRNNYSSCQQNKPAEGCAIYIQALEDCISKAISSKDY